MMNNIEITNVSSGSTTLTMCSSGTIQININHINDNQNNRNLDEEEKDNFDQTALLIAALGGAAVACAS